MRKLPFMQFFVIDWIADTRRLTPDERGFYIDLCALIWKDGDNGTMTIDGDELASFWGVPDAIAIPAVRNLARKRVIGLSENLTENRVSLTVFQRRIARDQKKLSNNRKRQQRWYEKNGPNADLTLQKSEVRSHKQKEGEKDKGFGGTPSATAPPDPAQESRNLETTPNAGGFDLRRAGPTPAPSAEKAPKRPAVPKPDRVATPPREHWQRVYAHVFEWLKKRKHGADPGITDKERGLLRSVYDTYGPWTALALWDMWVEPERKWSKWAYDRGYCLDAFFNTKGAILDDPRWKDKAAGHEKRYIATAEPAFENLLITGVLDRIIASNCKVPEKKK